VAGAAPNKQFDCVEMKRRAQEVIRARLAGLTREQQLPYWRQRDVELAELQRRLREAAAGPGKPA
jgi:hypothetical protein